MFDFVDPRKYQILSLSLLIVLGLWLFRFDTTLINVAFSIAGSIVVQLILNYFSNQKILNLQSSFITGCSLALLLRTQHVYFLFLACVLAIGSKFIFSYSQKHLFNPANFAITIFLFSGWGWVSPGQWGHSLYLILFLILIGGITVWKALRYDVAFVFLVTFSVLVIGRALWVGDPMEIPMHRLSSGSLILFSFFMITDPRSTPSHPYARYIFSISVAILGWYLQSFHFKQSALFYSLFIVSSATFALDYIFKHKNYQWPEKNSQRPAI